MFLGTKCSQRCESQWPRNIRNFHFARVKRPQSRACPLDERISEGEAWAITVSQGTHRDAAPGQAGGYREACTLCLMGECLSPSFQVLLRSQTGHRRVKNGWGPGSPASAPFFTCSPYEAGGLQEDGALHPWKAKPARPLGRISHWGLDEWPILLSPDPFCLVH